MQRRPQNINRIRADLRSSSAETRRLATQDLCDWARTDASIAADALPLFREIWQNDTDPWALMSAARGIEHATGPAEGRAAMLALLDRPQQNVVSTAVLNLDGHLSVDQLFDLCARATDPGLRRVLVTTLGRTKDPRAFDLLVAALNDEDVRPWAIEALAKIGLVAAVEHIEPYLRDTTDAWPEDNHGPMIRVCDVASDAIRRLRGSAGQPSVPDRPTPDLSSRQSQPATANVRFATAFPSAATSNGTLFALFPLGAAIFTIPWFLIFVIGVVGVTGTARQTPDRTRAMDFVSIIPPLIGVSVGLWAFSKRRIRGVGRQVLLAFGCLMCAAVAFPFLAEARSITAAEEASAPPQATPNPPPKRVPIPSGKPPPMEARQPDLRSLTWMSFRIDEAVSSLEGYKRVGDPPLVLIHNLADKDADSLLREMWAVRASIVAELFESPPHLTVVVFCAARSTDYDAMVRQVTGSEPTSPSGFYSRAKQAVFLNNQAGALGTACHELTHALIDEDMRDIELPIWLNEGIASVYEWPELKSTGRYVGGSTHRLSQIRDAGPIPLEKLIAASSPSATAGDFGGPDAGRYQATARLLCVYLQQQGKLADLYRAARGQLRGDASQFDLRALIERMCGRSLEDLEKQFKAWLNTLPAAP